MRRSVIILISLFFLLSGRCLAADKAASAGPGELSPALLNWMSQRYTPNTLLGLKWKAADKAKLVKAADRTWTPVAGLGAPAASRPARRLDFGPAMFTSPTDSYIESDTYDFRFASLGGKGAGWAAGYVNMSEVDEFETYYRYETKANVLYAAMMVSMGTSGMAPYAYFGAARVAYDKTDTDYNWLGVPTTEQSSGTEYTPITGFGLSLSLPDMPVGLFFEMKMIMPSGDFDGLFNALLGVSLSM